jgi:hypothetical protein
MEGEGDAGNGMDGGIVDKNEIGEGATQIA